MAQLYQTFNCDLPSSDLKKAEKIVLINRIEELDGVEQEMVFTLIYEHYTKTLPEGSNIEIYPYGCKCDKDDITFNLTKIPIPLRHILYRFINRSEL